MLFRGVSIGPLLADQIASKRHSSLLLWRVRGIYLYYYYFIFIQEQTAVVATFSQLRVLKLLCQPAWLVCVRAGGDLALPFQLFPSANFSSRLYSSISLLWYAHYRSVLLATGAWWFGPSQPDCIDWLASAFVLICMWCGMHIFLAARTLPLTHPHLKESPAEV